MILYHLAVGRQFVKLTKLNIQVDEKKESRVRHTYVVIAVIISQDAY